MSSLLSQHEIERIMLRHGCRRPLRYTDTMVTLERVYVRAHGRTEHVTSHIPRTANAIKRWLGLR